MYLFSEPGWRYFLFMGFICVYSLYRVIAPLYTYHRQKWQRIRKLAEKALQERRKAGELIDTHIKVSIPVLSFEKRCMMALEFVTAGLVFLISLGWGMRLMQTAIHTHRGIVAASEQDGYRATKEYQLALKSNPVASKLYWSYSALQSDEDRHNGELSAAQLKVRLHPDDPEAYNKLGGLYVNLKRYPEAIKAYRNAVLLRPNSGVLHSNLGSALSADLQLEAAITEFQRAINTDPNYGPYHNNLGDVYFYQHKWDQAEDEYRTAIQDNQALIQPYWRLSEILAKQGRRAEAKAVLQGLLDQSHMPEDAVIIGQLRSAIAAMK